MQGVYLGMALGMYRGNGKEDGSYSIVGVQGL